MSKVIFQLTEEDIQPIARQRTGRNLTRYELDQVKKGIEFGLECWEEVVETAIDELERSD